jgi:2-C-methyl-D-erythritol 4-phosphate cytidylyltransferase
VQTPQTFQSTQIKKAYTQPYSPLFTDDASVLESVGESIFLVEGNRENIKITTPLDLVIGEYLLDQRK